MRPLAELTETDFPTLQMVNEHAAVKAFHDARPDLGTEWDTFSIRMKKSILKSMDSGSDFWSAFRGSASSAKRLSAANARQMKPIVVKHMNTLFGCPQQSALRWVKPLQHVAFFAFIDFGSMNYQLRYAVGIKDGDFRWPSIGLPYERLMGFAMGGWDQIPSDAIESSVDVLVGLIARLENLYQGMVPLMKGTHNKAL